MVNALSDEVLATMKLNEAGVYLGGECMMHNALLTGRLTGEVPDQETLEHTCLNMLIGGLDTSASALNTLLTLIAKQQDSSDGTPVT